MNKDAIAIPGSNRPPLPDAKLIGKADSTERIKVSVYARRNPSPPGRMFSALPGLHAAPPAKRKWLSDEDFNAVYGSDPGDLKNIAEWARHSGLKVLDQSAPQRRVLVQGDIAAIERAFGVQLNEYEHPRTGPYRGREGSVYVPPDLCGIIEGVFGLDLRKVGHRRLRRGRYAPAEAAGLQATISAIKAKGKSKTAVTLANLSNNWPGVFFPPQVASLYNYPPGTDGSGQNIAIFAFNGTQGGDPHGGYNLAALKTYFEKVLGGATPAITDVVVQGPGNDPGPETTASGKRGDSTDEILLDMCVVGSVAPGAHIFMYFTEFNSQGWVDAVHQAITDANQISVISISYGNPEDDPQGAWTPAAINLVNQAFEAAGAKGITICCASGDDGSLDDEGSGAHADFPASSPFVLGVGGTKLVANSTSNPTAIADETVWNDSSAGGGAGGGGISAVFSLPSYQNGANVPPSAEPPHKIGRGVPDVSAVADPNTGVAVIHINGTHLDPVGGTSAAAPLWAALVARLNEALKSRCGFLNPVLYTKAAKGVLRDITVGNNGDYEAGPGWDACTGLGSPDGQKLLKALSGGSTAATSKKAAK